MLHYHRFGMFSWAMWARLALLCGNFWALPVCVWSTRRMQHILAIGCSTGQPGKYLGAHGELGLGALGGAQLLFFEGVGVLHVGASLA